MSDMKPNHFYYPDTLEKKLGYLVEEAGEVLAAAGQSLRWGLARCNPELPVEQRVSNQEWLLSELRDLKQAIHLVEDALSPYRHHDRNWWCWDEENPDVVARRDDGMTLEQQRNGWRATTGPDWCIDGKAEHDAVLAAYDRWNPMDIHWRSRWAELDTGRNTKENP